MMHKTQTRKYVVTSCIFHAAIFLILVLNYHFSTPLAVIENTNQHDVISAVVLGDTAKSKILPHEEPSVKPVPKPEPVKKPEIPPPPKVVKPKPEVKKPTAEVKVDKDAIALKAAKKKTAAEKAKAIKKKQQDLFAKDLLADISKQRKKKHKPVKNELQAKFAKMLREQAEQSLRQNLLNEEIKLKGKMSRLAQGIVDKYKALIIQAIGENWLVPLQANKKLTSELMIRLGPGGLVLDVQITKSSGDPALDSSARAAVLKASPLPVPNKAEEFEAFRQFVLKVKPENVVES